MKHRILFSIVSVFLLISFLTLPAFAELTDTKVLIGQNFEGDFTPGTPNGQDLGNLTVANKKPKDSSGTQEANAYTTTAVLNSSTYGTEGNNNYFSFTVNSSAVGKSYSSETDSYLDFMIYSGSTSSYGNFHTANAAYYAFDADIATDASGYQNGMGLNVVVRKGTSPASGSGISFAKSGSTVKLGGTEIASSPYQWTHVTVLVQVQRNAVAGSNTNIGGSKVSFYVNGKNVSATSLPSTGTVGEYLSAFRFSMKGGAHTIEAGTLLLDNAYVRSFGEDGTLASLFASSSKTLGDAGYPYYDSSAMPAVCRVGDVYYSSFETAFNDTPSGAVIDLIAPVYGFTVPNGVAKTVRTNGNVFTYTKDSVLVDVEETSDTSGKIYLINHDCTVKFMDIDGSTVLEEKAYASTDTPAYSKALPFYLSNGGRFYKVTGWAKTKSGKETTIGKIGVYSSLTYYPVYSDVTDNLVYSVLHSEGNFVCTEKTGNDATDEAAFRAGLSALQDGDILTLRTDIRGYSASSVIEGITAEVDLFGHTVTVLNSDKAKAKISVFSLMNAANFKLYSSIPGAVIYNYSNGSNGKGGLLFEFRGSSYRATVGNGTDNLSYYGSSIAYMQTGTNAENAVLTLNGGFYCRNVSDYAGFFAGKSGTDGNSRILATVCVNNATLVSTGGQIIGLIPLSNYYEDGTPSFTFTFNDSKIYMLSADVDIITNSTSTYEESVYSSALDLRMNGTDVFGKINLHAGQTLTADENCRFFSLPDSAAISEGCVVAYADDAEALTLSWNVFPSTELTNHSLAVSYKRAVASAASCHTAVWNYLNGKTVIAYGVGSAVIPNEQPNTVGVAGKYEYRWQAAAEGNDLVYTEIAKSTLSVKAKLTLWSDFVYDIYLPVADVAGGYVQTVKLGAQTCALSETCVIDGAEYYHLTFTDISASRSADSFLLVLTGQTMDGVDLTSAFRLSIPAYCEAVLSGDYSNEAKKLSYAILAYSNEAYAYFGKTADSSVTTLLSSYSAYQTAYAVKPAEEIGGMKNVLSGATLILLPTVNVRFLIADTYSGSGSFRVAWNGSSTVFQLSDGLHNGNKYVDLPLHASNLSDTLELSLSDGTINANGAYSIAAYAESMKTDGVYSLAKALCVFADAASAYKATVPTKDDKLPEKDASKIYLAENTRSEYRILLTPSAGTLAKEAAEELVEKLRARGIGIAMPVSETSAVTSYEILVGYDAKYRSNCKVTYSTLNGPKGYRIFTVGDKIVIAGGSDAAIAEGVTYFTENILHLSDSASLLRNVTVERTLSYQNEPVYPITGITVGAYPLKNYTFVVSSSADTAALNFAKAFRDRIYSETGIYLKVGTSAGTNKPFYVYSNSQGGSTGFLFSVSNGSAVLGCSYRDNFNREAEKFADAFLSGTGAVNYPAGYTYEGEGNVLYYSQFGAVGDGVTDDFNAIYNAHTTANTNGFTVRADAGAVYYIGQTTKPIPIRTDTDWTGATFIIDDSVVDQAHRTYNLFQVKSSIATKTVPSTQLAGLTLKKGQTNIGLTFETDCLIRVTWNDHKVYVRYGLNENSGSSQSEMFLVDKDGNIDPSTPVAWDYDKIDSITVYSLADTPITVEGGTFITIANNQPRAYTYYARNIVVGRPHTTLKNIVHLIQGEGDTGAPYNGFFGANQTYDVTFDNLTFTGHKAYKLATDERNTMGSYDTDAAYSVKITWKDCRMSNSITDTSKWGVHASNFCKDLYVQGCSISRFDAHQGMYNVTITDTTIGFALNCIGGGLLTCENVTRVRGNAFITLRSDYGSTWDGDAIIKDCVFEAYSNDACTARSSTSYLFSGSYTAGWDFGYTCYLPEDVTLDNFTYRGAGTCYIFWNVPTSAATDSVNPYQITKTVTFRNMTATLPISPNAQSFASTVITKK